MVVLSKQDYINEVDCPLNDTTYYQQLTMDPILQHASEVKKLMSSMFIQVLINKKIQDF